MRTVCFDGHHWVSVLRGRYLVYLTPMGITTHPPDTIPLGTLTLPHAYPLGIPNPWKEHGTRHTYPTGKDWDQRYLPLPVDRQTPVKVLPYRNFVGG